MRSIVLDKSALQACKADELEQFSKKYRMVLPRVLVHEILSDDSVMPHRLSFFRKLRNCRFVVTRDLFDVIEKEKQARRPVSDIDDYDQTQQLKQKLTEPSEKWEDPADAMSLEQNSANERKIVEYRRLRLGSIAGTEVGRLAACLPAIARARGCSLANAWRQDAMTLKVFQHVWKARFPALPLLATRKSFYFMLGWLGQYYDFCRGSQGQGSCRDASNKVLTNEHYDIKYLLNLIVKDGIVSGDNLLCETAQAFFPGRLVWKNLQQAMNWRGLSK